MDKHVIWCVMLYEANPQSLFLSHEKLYSSICPKLSRSADIELELIVVSPCDKALYSSVKKSEAKTSFHRKLSPHLTPVIKY